tara:strand:- start:4484 stop:6376 length:1893 start_codon:yes stop_codon:yes gene_type:complete
MIRPGINKSDTPAGSEGQWIDSDFVRFRYGQPEKIGGFEAIGQKKISGPARAQHTWNDLEGRKYAALGTSKALYIYYEDAFYDITPLDTAISGATFTTTNTSTTVTVNKTSHALVDNEYITFTSVTPPSGTGYTSTDFELNTFEISNVTANTFEITMPTASTASTSAAGSGIINPYVEIGPTIQTYGYGWGTSTWGTVGWGNPTTSSQVILDPGSWSLDNFGQQLIATIKDGKTWVWDAGLSNPLERRAVIMTGAPTASRLTITSDRDRHVIHFGTETTIGDGATQDPMFIRFSDQENYNVYNPTSVNTAGTFRLDTGNKIVAAVSGKDYNLILTDQAAYVMQFVGPPFTFSIRQVGSNCGCIGQHAAVYADGQVFWMGNAGGFFKFDGTVKLLPSLIEDFVFTTSGNNIGVNYSSNEIIYASHNSLFNEINWFYPAGKPLTTPSLQNNRSAVYNYVENTWATMTLSRSTYADASTYAVPYATEYVTTDTPNTSNLFGATNTFGASTYYAHEVGVDKIDLSGNSSAIPAFVLSGDFDLPNEGDGQFLLRVSRFFPDFKNLVGEAKVTLNTKDFPISTNTTTAEFLVQTTTSKKDTRVRGRLANIKIENLDKDQSWRFGTFRADVNVDGRR